MKRAIGIFLAVLIGAALLAAGVVLFLGASERGTRVLAAQAERMLPLEIEGVSGTLWREFGASRVRLGLGDAALEIREVSLAIRVWPLIFENQLHVERARAQAVIFRPDGAAVEPDRPARLELPRLPLSIRVDQLSLDQLQLADQEFTAISGSAVWSLERLTVGYLDFTIAGVSLALSGRMEQGTNPVLSAEFLWSLPAGNLEGSGSLVGVTDRLQLEHRLEGPYPGDIRGRVDLSLPAQPRFDLALDAEPFQVGEVAFDALTGSASGTLDSLKVTADGRIDVPRLGRFPVAAELRGSVAGPYALEVSGEPLSGLVSAAGRFAWRDGVDLVLLGQVRDLDLAPLLGAVAEDTTGRASGTVGLTYREDRFALDVRELNGELNGRPVTGSLEAVRTAAGWELAPLVLAVGDNRASGMLSLQEDQLEVSAQIDAPDLAALQLGVEGDLQASLDARGSWPALEVDVDFESSSVAGFDAAAAGLSGSAVLAAGVLSVSLSAQRLDAVRVSLAQVRAEAQGPPEALTWALKWSDGRAAGSYARSGSAHAVTLASLELQAFQQRWSIGAPAAATYDQGALDVSGFCLSAQGSAACLSALSYHGGQISTAGRLEALPLGFASPWVSLPLRDDGYVEGAWEIEGAPGAWNGSVDLAARSLFLLMPDAEEAPIDLPDLELDGSLDGERLQVDVLAVDPGFSITGAASVVPAGPAGDLDGRLELLVTDLSVLRAFDYRIDSLSGELRGGLDLTGTLLAPRFEGRVQVPDASLRLNDPDLVFDDLRASLTIDDRGSYEFQASASNDGARLRAQAAGGGVFEGALFLEGTLVGEELQARHPDWTVTLSPDLTVVYREGRASVTGRIEIPAADVRIKTLPTSLPRPSDDVVVIGRQDPARTANGRVTVNVELVLGDDVVLSAAGVEARLAGTLKARLDERGRTSVRGKLDVSGGIVSTQGQTLTLESGSIVYNGPITNPYLDVRAVRMIEDRSPPIKVGLHIRGNADNLTTSVFSDPAMAEARALSFLVLGRDLEEGSTGDSNQVLAAAINLGLSRAGGITSEIKRLTGLDELSAMAETQNSFAIVAGKRITEDVYVRYTYDTLTAMSALLVRYSLTDRWHLEARSSEYSSMDLMYSFEK